MSRFWGLIAESGKRYQQKVEEGFSITMACFEPVGKTQPLIQRYEDILVNVCVEYKKTNYVLCTLWPREHVIQVPLNVKFGRGEDLTIHIQGGNNKTRVHLTGFYSDNNNSLDTSDSVIPRHSILVSQPKSEDRIRKRVSIMDEHKEVEIEDDDDDDEDDEDFQIPENGLAEESDDDEDLDDESDASENPSDDEPGTFINLEKKLIEANKDKSGKSAALQDSDDDDEEDIDIAMDDSDDDDDDDDDDEVEVVPEVVEPTKKKKKKKKSKELPKTPERTQAGNKTPADMRTPENQSIQLKTPSSVGHTPMKFVSKGGVMIQEMKVGSGPLSKNGKVLNVFYSGRLKSNNKLFDSSTSGPGFKFRLGKSEVIKGWDVGMEGMKVGGKRRLIIPPHMGYGKRGAPPDIPPNSTLVFDVELKNVS